MVKMTILAPINQFKSPNRTHLVSPNKNNFTKMVTGPNLLTSPKLMATISYFLVITSIAKVSLALTFLKYHVILIQSQLSMIQ